MGELDNTDKLLEDFNDVFSDIVNVTLFDGDKIIREDELTAGQEHSDYMFDGDLLAQDRDICKHWTNGNVRFALLGIENQATIDADMPLRIIGYDGASYRGQLYTLKNKNGQIIRNKNKRYPVVSLVLYFGKHPWNKPKKLSEAVNIPTPLANFVNDYTINVMDVRRLPRKTVDQFSSDFRIVADYFWQLENTGEYNGNRDQITHLEDLLNFFQYAANDDRFILEQQDLTGERRPNNMSEVLDRVIEKGIQQGIQQGKIQGEKEGDRKGKEKVTKLLKLLLAENNLEAIRKISEDPDYCEELLEKYHISG